MDLHLQRMNSLPLKGSAKKEIDGQEVGPGDKLANYYDVTWHLVGTIVLYEIHVTVWLRSYAHEQSAMFIFTS